LLVPDVAALQRLIAEVADDAAQASVIAERVAGYEVELSSSSCPAETAGFVAVLLHRWYTACEAAF
jgi:hypothetical protein